MAQYLHNTAFSPTISTFQAAINKGHFATWPGTETLNFKKIIGTTIATEKGHLDQERKNLRTTKIEINEDFFPSKNTSIANEVYTTMYNVKGLKELNNKAYVDLMGKFPHKS